MTGTLIRNIWYEIIYTVIITEVTGKKKRKKVVVITKSSGKAWLLSPTGELTSA